uniref:BPTI/Kunitz inhibitor domain-containing protein n=1 Tax=Anser brachyrhynchus TaxID=132585 RepID=A0A8B9BWR5_9AVES
TMSPGVCLLLGLLILGADLTPGLAEKPGTCPTAAPEGLFYPCSFQCLEDKDCLGSKKCCPLGCGPACLEPLQDTCHLPAAPGPCGGRELRFFYNVTSGRCETFPYGGCEGNPNNFGTRAACRRACAWKHSRFVSKLFLLPPQPP